jgi:hypothetical protein
MSLAVFDITEYPLARISNRNLNLDEKRGDDGGVIERKGGLLG